MGEMHIRSTIRIGKSLLSDFNYMDLHRLYVGTAASHLQQAKKMHSERTSLYRFPSSEFQASEAMKTARLMCTSLALTREHFLPNPPLRAQVSQENEKSGHDFPAFFPTSKKRAAVCSASRELNSTTGHCFLPPSTGS